ncbi:outer membrane lipoprotein carrier protein LolA [Burkholderia cepacia]|uniref:outer membrane lipoprotein carrier protein LolA n=1 Tax=Burkholderia cepacia TaxID=292 RepID=UPI00157ACCA2|nr:outer membrane lipoprotein carrier protein LolA [Burkholderia cepacia]NTX49674.1 outer membrane lipoprotein carrier protein LolA [Burkholderia cepacia]
MIIQSGNAAAIALAAAPARAADAAPAWTLDRLMSTLAQHKSGRATFTETKYLSIATQPVESSGELVFVAPDHLEKHTLSPKPEHLVVDGDMLTVERNNRKYTLALARYPELGAFIDSIRATLAGNRFALEQVYQVALAGRGDDWTLTLTPLDSRMLKVVSTITLDGTRDLLRSVAIRQADGDRSVMRLQPVPANPN